MSAKAKANTAGSVPDDKVIEKARANNEKMKKERHTKNERQDPLEDKMERTSDKSKKNITHEEEIAEEIASKEKNLKKMQADASNIEVPVSSTKIWQAKGTRSEAKGQAAVMGCSATLVWIPSLLLYLALSLYPSVPFPTSFPPSTFLPLFSLDPFIYAISSSSACLHFISLSLRRPLCHSLFSELKRTIKSIITDHT